MIIRRLVPAVFLVITLSGAAATLNLPVLKVGGVTYSNVTIIGANSTDLYFKHDKGLGNAKLKYLSPDLQKRFNYDPAKAKEAEQKRSEADLQYGDAVASDVASRAQKAAAARASEAVRSQPLADPVSDKSILGKAAPALAGDQWVGPKPELDGKCMLVVFWEPWSPASLEAVANLGVLQKQFTNKLVVVGVSTNSTAELGKMDSPKVAFALASDSGGKLGAAAGITSIPSVLLVDAKGVVRYAGHPAALTDKYLKALLSSAE